MTIRSQKTKEAFIKYLEDHPQERFWQAVRNFSKYNYIFGGYSPDKTDAKDTFYEEENNE